MTIAEMLMKGITNVVLMESWSKDKENLVEIEKKNKKRKSLALIPLFIFSIICPAYSHIEKGSNLLPLIVTLHIATIGIALGFVCFAQLDKLPLRFFQRDSKMLFKIMGEKITGLKALSEFKDFAFTTLVRRAELCLFVQSHRADDHQLITKRQDEFAHIYEVFKTFNLLHPECEMFGYKVYYERAQVYSKIPDWTEKMATYNLKLESSD